MQRRSEEQTWYQQKCPPLFKLSSLLVSWKCPRPQHGFSQSILSCDGTIIHCWIPQACRPGACRRVCYKKFTSCRSLLRLCYASEIISRQIQQCIGNAIVTLLQPPHRPRVCEDMGQPGLADVEFLPSFLRARPRFPCCRLVEDYCF